MCDMQINYKMGKYGVYKYNVCKIGQIYRLYANYFPFSNLSIIKWPCFNCSLSLGQYPDAVIYINQNLT